jgi:DNA-binding HxlR family transcriptional regulator
MPAARSSTVPARSAATATPAAADLARLRMLIGLCHRRWSLPILAELDKEVRPGGGGGAKFVTLANRLRLSRETLRDTLEDLIERDYLMRNPGVGHPMRPEYLLTEDGHDVAPHAAAIIGTLRKTSLEDVALRKWSLPTLYAIGRGVARFSHLRAVLPGATSRALTLTLKDLERVGLVVRRVTDDYPPMVLYRPHRSAKRIVRLMHAMP